VRRVASLAAAALGELLALSAAGATPQDALGAARALRLQGCDGHPGIRVPLRASASLNVAAAQWSRGTPLASAIARSGYREDQSAGMHLSGTANGFKSVLAQHLCPALTDAAMTDAGLLVRGDDIWLVLAAPFTAPGDGDDFAREVLQSVNSARAEPRRCGGTLMARAAPLRLNELLNRAALAHAQDMLHFGYFEHAGHDGSSPGQRIAAAGYRYRLVGENLASGPESAQEVVRGWLGSPAHCQNLMDARFADMGIAYAASRSGEPHIYWVQEFAAAR
jgi:uncharacterized protein YkwD